MLKKVSLIAIIAVLAYSQVGYYFIMRHSQSLHKKSIKHKLRSQLKDAELEIISLTDNFQQIDWLEEDKEFLLNGEMYDVVKRTIINGNVILYCINDKKEKAMVDQYNKMTKQNSTSDKKGKHIVDNLLNLFIVDADNNYAFFFTSALNNFHSFDSRLQDNLINKISPPPKA